MLRQLKRIMVISALALASGNVAALTLQDVDFSSLSGDRTEVVLTLMVNHPKRRGTPLKILRVSRWI